MKPFQKVFYVEGKPIYTEEQVKQYQKEKAVIIRSKHFHIPQPFIKWSETQFPAYIMSIIQSSGFTDPMPI